MRRSILTAALPIALALTAHAEAPNLSTNPTGEPGAAAQLILAQRTYTAAMQSGDPLLLITAIRLAREVALRPPTGWTRASDSDGPVAEVDGMDDPAGPRAIEIAQGLAGDDPALQDLVYDLDAQLPHGRRPVAINATGALEAGQAETWRMVLPGEITAEVGLIGGEEPLGLRIHDETDALICALPPTTEPALCRFTPAGNGFFLVEVTNAGSARTSYRLVGN